MRNDLTMVDDGDMVAKLLRLLQIMCGQEDRRSSLVEVDNALPELPAQLDVDAGGRLVEHQDRRIVDHRLGDQQPASHAAGERPGIYVRLFGAIGRESCRERVCQYV